MCGLAERPRLINPEGVFRELAVQAVTFRSALAVGMPTPNHWKWPPRYTSLPPKSWPPPEAPRVGREGAGVPRRPANVLETQSTEKRPVKRSSPAALETPPPEEKSRGARRVGTPRSTAFAARAYHVPLDGDLPARELACRKGTAEGSQNDSPPTKPCLDRLNSSIGVGARGNLCRHLDDDNPRDKKVRRRLRGKQTPPKARGSPDEPGHLDGQPIPKRPRRVSPMTHDEPTIGMELDEQVRWVSCGSPTLASDQQQPIVEMYIYKT